MKKSKKKSKSLTWRQSFRMVMGHHPDQEICPNWPFIIFILMGIAFYWGGKLDARAEMQMAAISHGCASAHTTVPDDGMPKVDLDTFKWNVSPEIK